MGRWSLNRQKRSCWENPQVRDLIQQAAEVASHEDVDPSGDIHATAAYRRHLVQVLAQRALTEAFERAENHQEVLRSGGNLG